MTTSVKLVSCLLLAFYVTCVSANPTHQAPCGEDEYRCERGRQCIPNLWVCDGDNDCNGGDDERQNCENNSRQCDAGFFHCAGGRCIPDSWLCDKDDDCSDGSDENGCTYFPGQNPSRRHPTHQFDSKKKRK